MASPPVPNHPWLQGLNPPQLEAATALDGPILVLAGAGTGKTRALTARLAQILAERRAWPSEILAVTFTNKAAAEMRQRLTALVGPAAEGMPFVGTFHSIAARMLRRHAELVGLRSNFTILDTDDVLRLLKRIIVEAGIDEKRWPARQLSGLIDRWKNRAETPDKVPQGEAFAFADGRGSELYAAYQAQLLTLNAADFGDLLLHIINIFEAHADVLADWQRRFKYVLVDEYQDTNAAQYRWLTLLAAKSKGGQGNICCVGDDDQSIYSWRGAEVANILRFEKDFPGAKTIRLEQNYRSTPHILAAAAHVIAHNQGRLGKTLWTSLDSGEKVQVTSIWDGPEEARLVGEKIERLLREGVQPSDIAILVRASFQTREFEDRFISIGLPYRIVGGFRFYERAEIRDALAYLRLVAQPDDGLAFERIVNVPKRGLGDKAQSTIQAHARSTGLSLPAAAQAIVETEELSPAARRSLAELLAGLRRWRGQIDQLDQGALAQAVLEESGYVAMLEADRSAEAAGRLDNLAELVRAMEGFPDLQAFLEHVSLVMENDRTDAEAKVTMMTLHAAKGLEFDHVFLPGWEEGLFPSQRSLDEGGAAALEEERRLAYVGITRARRRATILHAQNRRVYGQWTSAIPSRFLAELPPEHVEMHSTLTGGASLWRAATQNDDPFAHLERGKGRGPGWERASARSGEWANATSGGLNRQTAARPARTVTLDARPLSSTVGGVARTDLRVGDRVFHAKFGMGTVKGQDGNKLEIEFDQAGTKMVLDSFVSPG
ncbi:UvrD-helicase domain-containing protein [Sandaracinobacter sp. RS1-74]|uniref:ATP-dependent helicase n=1 Tax=Sandaracinobacteroides sayramensis TaxID=2913411 RepID=UPI001EDA779D|nr:UvrD-helicase domain-containing protein [Sandaracinobacteroides sayramensis]MCG2841544.1 UvrD-helicase domain-containing protein [Sandaracinobacteroides sayramensis]